MWLGKMNKKALVTIAPLLFYLGVVMLGVTATLIGDVVFDKPSTLTGAQIATLQNSFLATISEYDIVNKSSYEERFLFPKPTEEFQITLGMAVIRWDDLGNAIDGRNFSSIQQGSIVNRSYFVTINGNSTAIDPFTHPQCLIEINSGINTSYYCTFVYNIGNKSAGINSPFNEITLSSSSTNHRRTVDVMTILPKQLPTTSTTTQDIVDYIWNKIKLTMEIWTTILTYVYYFIVIGFGLALLFGIIFGLRWIFDAISGRG